MLSVPTNMTAAISSQELTPIQESIFDPASITNSTLLEENMLWETKEEDEAIYNKTLTLKEDPDIKMTFEQLVKEYGCKFEEHDVTTDDFYVLKVFRINYGDAPPNEKKTVFLQHGLFADASTWVIHKEESLAFRLAKAGYDVWLGNNRGNIYSHFNTKISFEKDPKDFFNYSFYDLGKHDAPAQIDMVRQVTGHSKISYIGHSQGTSQMFSALS